MCNPDSDWHYQTTDIHTNYMLLLRIFWLVMVLNDPCTHFLGKYCFDKPVQITYMFNNGYIS